MSKAPNIVVTGTGEKDAREFSMVALDCKGSERVVGLAKRLAENTGRTVTLRDADGNFWPRSVVL